MAFGKQPICLLKRGGKVRLGLDHHSVRVDRTGDFAHLVPDVKARLGTLILFAEIATVHPHHKRPWHCSNAVMRDLERPCWRV